MWIDLNSKQQMGVNVYTLVGDDVLCWDLMNDDALDDDGYLCDHHHH